MHRRMLLCTIALLGLSGCGVGGINLAGKPAPIVEVKEITCPSVDPPELIGYEEVRQYELNDFTPEEQKIIQEKWNLSPDQKLWNYQELESVHLKLVGKVKGHNIELAAYWESRRNCP